MFDKPHVSKLEFEKVIQALVSHNFTQVERNRVRELFVGDMTEAGYQQSGIDKGEIETKIKWLREHKSQHTFSDDQITILESKLLEYL